MNTSTFREAYAIKAALNFGDKEKKDGLYFLLGQILNRSGDKEIAYKHFMLAYLIRSEQDWRIPNALKIAVEETFVNGIEYKESLSLYKELLKFWKEHLPIEKNDRPKRLSGKIVQVNDTKLIGKITGSDGTPYFFHFNEFKGTRDRIRKDLLIEFQAKPPRENIPGKNWVAFDIIPVNKS